MSPPREPGPSVPPPPRHAGVVALGFIGVAFVVAGASLLVARFSRARLAGTIASRDGELGTWTGRPIDCTSGRRAATRFPGAELRADAPAGLRVQVESRPGGDPAVRLLVAGRVDPVVLDPAACDRFDVAVDHSGFVRAGVPEWDGHVYAACDAPGGGRVELGLDFRGCH